MAKGIPMDEVKGWQNRIVGYGEESPDQLLANPHNHRIHPKRQQDALSGSLETLGVIQTVIVNKATGHIVDGHLRVTMALREGQTSIPVTYVELTEAEEAQALLSLDPIAAMAANDRDKVDELLRMVNTDNEQVMKHLADFASENKLNYGQSEQVDAEPQVDRAAELQEKWRTATGQLWKLGEHRLLIGDCTVRENVERLMGGDRARFEFSDPPYEFETGGGGVLKEAQHMKDIKAAGINEFDPASIELMTDTAVFCCNKKLVPAYIELANRNNQAWDLCFYKKENTPPNFGGHLMTDTEYLPVIGKQSPNSGMEKNAYSKAYIGGLDEDHLVAWQKPIGLVEKFIKLFSNNGEIIIDRFACTGTTIIAAHNLKRRCYAMEISEKYSAVILERFQTATGITPELIK